MCRKEVESAVKKNLEKYLHKNMWIEAELKEVDPS